MILSELGFGFDIHDRLAEIKSLTFISIDLVSVVLGPPQYQPRREIPISVLVGEALMQSARIVIRSR